MSDADGELKFLSKKRTHHDWHRIEEMETWEKCGCIKLSVLSLTLTLRVL